jgi:anti-sigma factor RsiW
MECAENLRVQAYLDGELDAVAAAEIERHLATCEECRALLQELRQVRTLLRDKLPKTSMPGSLRAGIMDALDREPPPVVRLSQRKPAPPARVRPFWIGVFSGVGGSAVAAAVTLLVVNAAFDRGLTADLVADHTRSLLSSHLIDVVSTDQHTVKPWFNGRINYAPPVVDLEAQGFPLVGGRLDYVDHRPVAVLIYRYLKHPIDVYVFPDSSGKAGSSATPLISKSDDGYSLVEWHRGGMVYWAVSDASSVYVRRFAEALTSASPSP